MTRIFVEPCSSSRGANHVRRAALAAVCLLIPNPAFSALDPRITDPPNSELTDSSPHLSTESRIAVLQSQIDGGATLMEYEQGFGYLRSVLKGLDIAQSSQLLVFSKTSCQRERISPGTPRAVYFSDNAYVAFIPGSAILEISTVNGKSGAVFYTLDQKPADRARFVRRNQCLECHTSLQTLNVPGYLVRSYATDGNGVVDITDGCSMVDHRTPIADRWGGWYICGSAAPILHRGNIIGDSTVEKQGPDTIALGVASLRSMVDTAKYLHTGSDLVALMVLEHQAHMQNLLTRLHQEWQMEAKDSVETTTQKAAVNAFLRYLLFVDEALLDVPIKGGSDFASEFEHRGPHDKEGRSLRQFELQTHLFKYPCSYLIYSESFDSLPRAARIHIYHRLGKILRGEDDDPAFASIPSGTRRAILEILLETKTDLPIDWKL